MLSFHTGDWEVVELVVKLCIGIAWKSWKMSRGYSCVLENVILSGRLVSEYQPLGDSGSNWE